MQQFIAIMSIGVGRPDLCSCCFTPSHLDFEQVFLRNSGEWRSSPITYEY